MKNARILKSAKAGRVDKILWNATKGGIFTLKSLQNIIMKSINQRIDWQATEIWSTEIPARICYFMHETVTGAIFTKERLHTIFPEVDTKCSLYDFAGENTGRLFLAVFVQMKNMGMFEEYFHSIVQDQNH